MKDPIFSHGYAVVSRERGRLRGDLSCGLKIKAGDGKESW